MDSDGELIDDDDVFNSDPSPFDHCPFPSDCQNEIEGIESFSRCFINRYNNCPALFMGSLQEACESIFNLPINERRPILVYIHHDKSLLTNIFCQDIFCKDNMIEYLLENYIVWPWDITFESNRIRLKDIWSKLSTEFTIEFSEKQCPILLGIMRHSIGAKGWLSSYDYECKLLQQWNTLIQLEVESSREKLFNELNIFKKQFNRNEQILSFDFLQETRLPPELFLEITDYLYLNDIIYAFSSNIIPFLINNHARLHLSESSDEFLNQISQKLLKPEQIVSLRCEVDSHADTLPFNPSAIISKIISLTFVNLKHSYQIKKHITCYLNIIFLSLRYDIAVNYETIVQIIQRFQNSIRRVEVHATKIRKYYFIPPSNWNDNQNTTIEYLLLNIDFSNFRSYRNFNPGDDEWILRQTIDFIQCMINLRSVKLLINSYNLNRFLVDNEWNNLINQCCQLRKITFQITGDILNDQQSAQIRKIQKDLHELRDTIKFQVIKN